MKTVVKNIILSVTLSFAFVGMLSVSAASQQADLAKNIFRLHIIANSNSKADQDLKLEVRDKIIATFGQDLFNLDKVEKVANDFITSKGYSYTAKAEVGNFWFPVKTYGDISMPAGNYNALRITLGEGKGQNWWCCIYPNLCINGKVAVFDSRAKAILKGKLSKEEYKLITKKEPLRWRILEWWNSM